MISIRQLLLILLTITLVTISFSLVAQNTQKNMNTKTATFGAGCFWCTEAIFSRIEGIIDVKPGFSGGHTENPSYNEVKEGGTGHAEVAHITYDPEIVNYATLLEVFWKTHNPTTLNQQGADVGTMYRSVIFYHDDEQKMLATESKTKLDSAKIWNNPIVTEIVPFTEFYPAEDYHNDYYTNNPANSYCNFVITPKVEKFEKVFKDLLKE